MQTYILDNKSSGAQIYVIHWYNVYVCLPIRMYVCKHLKLIRSCLLRIFHTIKRVTSDPTYKTFNVNRPD